MKRQYHQIVVVVALTVLASLAIAQEPEKLLTLEGASGSCAFSPDGNLIAASYGHLVWFMANPDGVVKIVSISDGKQLLASKGATLPLFSPDGKLLAAAGLGRVSIWEIATGKERATIPGAGDKKTAVPLGFSEDGARLTLLPDAEAALEAIAKFEEWRESVQYFDIATKTIAVPKGDDLKTALDSTHLWECMNRFLEHGDHCYSLGAKVTARREMGLASNRVELQMTGLTKRQTIAFRRPVTYLAMNSGGTLLAVAEEAHVPLIDVASSRPQGILLLDGAPKSMSVVPKNTGS